MHETLFTYLSYHWTIFDSHKHWLKEQVREIHVRRQMSESWDIFMVWKINSGLVWAVGQYCEKKFGADYERSFFYNFYSQFLKFCSNLSGIVYLPSDCLNRYQGICSIFLPERFSRNHATSKNKFIFSEWWSWRSVGTQIYAGKFQFRNGQFQICTCSSHGFTNS